MSRSVSLIECNRCHLPILTGHDDYAAPVSADLIPLTRASEIRAMSMGLNCWRIDAERKAWRTDRWRIASDCPMPLDHRVAEHRCGQPIPADWAAPVATVTRQPLDPDNPPF